MTISDRIQLQRGVLKLLLWMLLTYVLFGAFVVLAVKPAHFTVQLWMIVVSLVLVAASDICARSIRCPRCKAEILGQYGRRMKLPPVVSSCPCCRADFNQPVAV